MYNPGYQVDVIDPYYPPPVEVIEVMPPPMVQPVYGQPAVVVTQPQTVYVEDNNGVTRDQMECCLMLGACCVMEEAGCVIL
ncbi:hypothetical protein KR044_011021 [Drosophila immigrans]|nr:hypothetical protein KR044_011021 [Drosophila immigrans]